LYFPKGKQTEEEKNRLLVVPIKNQVSNVSIIFLDFVSAVERGDSSRMNIEGAVVSVRRKRVDGDGNISSG
jgi:hypothetical protein